MKVMKIIAGGIMSALLAADAAIYVSPTGATDTNHDNSREAADTINGNGLSDASLVATGASTANTLPTHNIDSGDMWRTAQGFDWSGAGGAVVTYTLGASYDLTGMHIWNYNEYWGGSSATHRGVKNAKIEYQAGDTNWITYAENMVLAEGTGNSSYDGTNYTFSSTLEGVTAVKFTCLTNWAEDTGDRIGLSEVRFIAEETELPLAPVAKQLWINGTTATLYWDVGAGSTGYIVKRSETQGSNYVTIATLGDTDQYADTNLTAGTTYYYVIAGENLTGEGPPSSELSGTAASYTVISDGGGTWGNSIYTLPESVFDGDTSTFYDGADAAAWVGIDLGDGNEHPCPGIDFYPRAGNESRMNGAEFQGSMDGSTWITLATVTETPPAEWNRIYTGSSTAYRYYRCLEVDYGNVAEIRFLANDEVDDVVYSTAPEDGEIDVDADAGIVVTGMDITVDLNSLYSGHQMWVNSNTVTSAKDSSGGITTFAYAGTLAYESDYTVQLEVYRTDGITNTVDFSFTTVPDYYGGDYLIAPGLRNGGFEYVNGILSNATTVTDFGQIDHWVKLASVNDPSTRYSATAAEGTRYLNTQRGMMIANLTDHIIEVGDRFEFKWVQTDRPAGVIVSLCYSNAVDGVTNIVDSAVTVPDVSWAIDEHSGSYTFGPGHPAVGSTLGLMIQENPMTAGETTITEAHVDKVRLLYGQGPSSAPDIRMVGVDSGAETVSLSWDSETDILYYVISSPNLITGAWTTNLVVIGDGSTITTNVSSGVGYNQYFRLQAK